MTKRAERRHLQYVNKLSTTSSYYTQILTYFYTNGHSFNL